MPDPQAVNTASSTGNGPIIATRNLYFNGENSNYELFEVKFLSYLRMMKLHVFVVDENGVLLKEDPVDSSKNSEVFACLVQFLDDKSLSIIIRDAKNNGRKSLEILRNHYIGSSKPRIISLYCELTTLKLAVDESITDYLLRGETTYTRLNEAGEKVSESLLIAMLLKGLPDEFKSFSSVILQQNVDKLSFESFKNSLKNYHENEKARTEHRSDTETVMKVESKNYRQGAIKKTTKQDICYSCGERGHRKNTCTVKNKYCTNCNSSTHNTIICKSKKSNNSSKSVSNSTSDDSSFVFSVNDHQGGDSVSKLLHDNSEINLLVDSGASAHIITDKSSFIRFDTTFNPNEHTIELANSTQMSGIVQGKGDAVIKLVSTNGKICDITLENALFIPSYKQNILSVPSMTKKGVTVTFCPDSALITTPNGTSFQINLKGKLYYINTINSDVRKKRSLKVWHETLGHCNQQDVLKLENSVEGMQITDKSLFQCDVCIEGKMTQFRNHKTDEKAKKPLELVHTDLAGPISPASKEGCKYAVIFVDDFSGVIFTYFIKQKSDTVKATEKFLADVSIYGSIERLRSDHGTEYTCGEFENLMTTNKIRHEFSAPFSAHQNGTAERGWRSLFDMSRCMIIQSELPKYLWSHAVRAATYIRNRCFSDRLKMTPIEAFTSRKPDVSKMHIFGSDCYAYAQDTKKLDKRAEKGRFIGYDQYSPAYMIYFPNKSTIKRVRCVEFRDNSQNCHDNDVQAVPISDVHENSKAKTAEKNQSKEITRENNVVRRNPSRNRKPPAYLDDYDTRNSSLSSEENFSDATYCNIDFFYKICDVPATYSEAHQCPDADQWQVAMQEEMQALSDNDCYELVPRPDQHVIGTRWVYTKKVNDDRVIYRARFVAKGYAQIPNIDYVDTFSPTARITSIRLIANLAAKFELDIHQLDVKCAYLNAEIDQVVYVEQPEGFKLRGENNEDLVFKLKKVLVWPKTGRSNVA